MLNFIMFYSLIYPLIICNSSFICSLYSMVFLRFLLILPLAPISSLFFSLLFYSIQDSLKVSPPFLFTSLPTYTLSTLPPLLPTPSPSFLLLLLLPLLLLPKSISRSYYPPSHPLLPLPLLSFHLPMQHPCMAIPSSTSSKSKYRM